MYQATIIFISLNKYIDNLYLINLLASVSKHIFIPVVKYFIKTINLSIIKSYTINVRSFHFYIQFIPIFKKMN